MKRVPPHAMLVAALLVLAAASASAATINVAMKDNFFSPKTLTVAVGDTVVWTNQGAVNHTATSGTGCTASGLFDSENVAPGGTYSFTFTAAGSVPYFCKPHCASGMTGTITVQEGLVCSAAASPLSGAAPLTVDFTASATGGTAPYAFLWDFGDGQTSTEAAVAHTYASPGMYTWTLTVTDAASATCLKSGKVNAQAATLSCEATASPSSGTAPLDVAFTSAGSGGTPPYAMLWDFGDGQTSPYASITHIYQAPGTYGWTLTLTDHGGLVCSQTGSVTVTAPSTLACSAHATPEGGAPPLEVAFTADGEGGTPPYAYAWTFGDGGVSTEQNPVHTYAGAGSYPWTVTVTDAAGGSCVRDDLIVVAAVSSRVFLASAARASGAQGTDWRTDAMLFNPGTEDLAYVLHYTPAGADGTSTLYSHAGVLRPGEAPLAANLVETLFGLVNSAGGLRFDASGPLAVTSRTYNDTGEGTYGQFAAARPAADAVGEALRAGTDGELIGLSQGARFRVNLGFSEVAGLPATVLVEFYDAGGNPLGDGVSVELDPFSWAQQSLAQLGLPSADGVRAEVKVVGGGAVLAYASQVDNNTGDAVFQPAQKEADVEGVGHQLIATVAKARGGYGTNWLTDLVLYNPSDSPRTAGLEYRAAHGTFSAAVDLAAGETRSIADVVASLFPGAGTNTAGALHVTAAGPVLLACRTYNQATETRTYGQFVPALGPSGLVASGASGDILQVTHNGDYRTNIGFSDLSGSGAEVQLLLFDESGNRVGNSGVLTVPPGGNLQQSLTALFGGHLLDAGRVSFQVVSGGPVYGYASVVDNRTGDAVFVPVRPR